MTVTLLSIKRPLVETKVKLETPKDMVPVSSINTTALGVLGRFVAPAGPAGPGGPSGPVGPIKQSVLKVAPAIIPFTRRISVNSLGVGVRDILT